MIEYLKNNPIALRHCILYEFLRKNPVEESFNAFCKTVGDDVIEKEEFEFCFKQFRQGIFDEEDNREPMTDMRDVFRNDKYALRAAVLFETLKSKDEPFRPYGHSRFYSFPRFQANHAFLIFEKFCKVIGNDMMEYREFEFWFYRFLNGEFDLNFERKKDKKVFEFTELPLDVMEKIVDYLNIFDRQALAKTCQSLHQFVQDQKLSLDTLELNIYMSVVYIKLGSSYVFYDKNDNGCVKRIKEKETFIQDVPFWKQALLEFKNSLKNPKIRVDTLQVTFGFLSRNMESEELKVEVIDELETALKSAHQLNVRELNFHGCSIESFSKILPCLKPGYLTTIEISTEDPSGLGMEIVVEMEQWKQAKYLNARNLYSFRSLRHFYHFNRFNVWRNTISVDDVRQMKKILLKSRDFEKCSLWFVNPIDTFAIQREFGAPFLENTCHYPILNSTEYFEMEVNKWRINITRKKK